MPDILDYAFDILKPDWFNSSISVIEGLLASLLNDDAGIEAFAFAPLDYVNGLLIMPLY